MLSACSTPAPSTGAPNARARDSTEYLFEVLADADCLLVIDNCEHLIEPVAELVDAMLAALPGVCECWPPAGNRWASSARRCAWCRRWACPPPARRRRMRPTTRRCACWSSGRGRSAPGSTCDDATVDAVVEIVRRLDGLPLAIELAAARLRVMPVGEIAARLSDRFRLLTGGSRTALPRHRTLRAVVEWSWDLLRDRRAAAGRTAGRVPGRRHR